MYKLAAFASSLALSVMLLSACAVDSPQAQSNESENLSENGMVDSAIEEPVNEPESETEEVASVSAEDFINTFSEASTEISDLLGDLLDVVPTGNIEKARELAQQIQADSDKISNQIVPTDLAEVHKEYSTGFADIAQAAQYMVRATEAVANGDTESFSSNSNMIQLLTEEGTSHINEGSTLLQEINEGLKKEAS